MPDQPLTVKPDGLPEFNVDSRKLLFPLRLQGDLLINEQPIPVDSHIDLWLDEQMVEYLQAIIDACDDAIQS